MKDAPHPRYRRCPHPACYDHDGHWDGCLYDDDDDGWEFVDGS